MIAPAVQVKCPILWLNIGLTEYFDLYYTIVVFFALVLLRPICSNKSMHTEFDVHAKCIIFLLNRGVRVYFDLYSLYFPNGT